MRKLILAIHQNLKMTIYNFEVEPEALDGFHSVRYLMEMCKLVCLHIIAHFHDVVLWDQPDAQIEVSSLKAILPWYIDLLQNSTVHQQAVEGPIEIHYIHAYYQMQNVREVCVRRFNLGSLQNVSPMILLEVFAKVLRDSLACLLPLVQELPADTRGVSTRVLRAMPDRLAAICRMRRNYESYFVSLRIKAEFHDRQDRIVFLTEV